MHKNCWHNQLQLEIADQLGVEIKQQRNKIEKRTKYKNITSLMICRSLEEFSSVFTVQQCSFNWNFCVCAWVYVFHTGFDHLNWISIRILFCEVHLCNEISNNMMHNIQLTRWIWLLLLWLLPSQLSLCEDSMQLTSGFGENMQVS